MLTVLKNLHFNFRSIKVTSLLSTMALFISTDIPLPTMVIHVMTFSNRCERSEPLVCSMAQIFAI